jgi:hypothetical protein
MAQRIPPGRHRLLFRSFLPYSGVLLSPVQVIEFVSLAGHLRRDRRDPGHAACSDGLSGLTQQTVSACGSL